jgi:hypothetical protein
MPVWVGNLGVFLAIPRKPWYTGDTFSLWPGISVQARAIQADPVSLAISDSTPAHRAA